MNTVKIFLASSAELKEDREQLRNFISVENDRLHQQNIYLKFVQWEYFLDGISDTRLQDEYNKKLKDCDIAVCLFFTKVGKYTAEEFDTAYETFKATGKPKIWTYFKDAPINIGTITDEINTLLAFKEKIGKLGHFYTNYTNIDNLKLKLKWQIEEFLQIKINLTTSEKVETIKLPELMSQEVKTRFSKQEILTLIDQDLDKAFDQLDNLFSNKNATYNDLVKEYIQQPNNFSLASFRARVRRFVSIQLL